MPRPKGSKNKKTLAKKSAPVTVEQLESEKAAQAAAIDALTAEVADAAQALKAKKAELKAAQKKYAALEKMEADVAAQAELAKRQADAETLAAAFIASGKSLDEVIEMLK